jgi:hypothetical protein
VLRGPNDCGKSVTLDAVSRLAGGNGAVTCRDKAAAGSVEGLGVKISVRQSARRSGELEALSLEGNLNIADLVTPPIKDPVAADRHRIKALLQLTGAHADWAMFAPFYGVRDHISHESMECADLVEMAAKIKRDLEAASRKEADAAEKADARAFACKQALEGIDLDVETNADLLQGALEDALFEQGQITAKSQSAKESIDRAREAQERLDKEASPPDVEGAKANLRGHIDCVEAFINQVEELESQLTKAKASLATARANESSAKERLRLEEAHAESVKGWRETIEASKAIEVPNLDAIKRASARVSECRQAIERAAVVRRAKSKASEATILSDEAKSHRKAADKLRESARATDDVLSEAVASESLTVRGCRLITQHPERGEVFYAERSDGTRWKLAIDEAIKRIRQLGAERTAIIPIPQAAWSELDPANKAAIHEYAVEKGVTIITAEATDGELRAEAFEEDET